MIFLAGVMIVPLGVPPDLTSNRECCSWGVPIYTWQELDFLLGCYLIYLAGLT